MVKVKEDVNGKTLPCEIYLDETEKENLDYYHKRRIMDWDVIGGVVGEEGDGKTVYAMQRCLYLDAGFNIQRVVFNEQQFNELVDNPELCPDGGSILWDEADSASEHHASLIMRVLKKKFKRIRKRNLFVLLVTPTFFDFNKYFAIHRFSFLIHVYSTGLERGFFNFFNRTQKRLLYIYGKKEWNMSSARNSFSGRFTKVPNGFPIDLSKGGEYDLKKDAATKEVGADGKGSDLRVSKEKTRQKYLNGMRYVLGKRGIDLNQYEYAEAFGVTQQTISMDFKKLDGELDN